MKDTHFICPICKKELLREENTLKCENSHSFDISSSGYVNLLNPGKKNNSRAGDSKEMIRARTSFLNSGYYGKIKDTLCDIVSAKSGGLIVDAGCGEGYYTGNVAKACPDSYVIGIDMSKYGAEHGAKAARREGVENISYVVSSIFDIPLTDNSTSTVINMFAPVACSEFARIMKKGGALIVGVAGKSHFDGLKRVLYSDVYDNEESTDEYEGFRFIECKNLKYEAKIVGNDTIKNLFTMTPYYFRTSLDDKKKLDGVEELSTHIEVNFYIYEKI